MSRYDFPVLSLNTLFLVSPVPILRSIGTKLTKFENMQKSRFYLIYLTSCDAKTLRHASWGLQKISDRYFDKEHFETNQKSLRLPVQKLWLT